jgi:hypothetical protein
MHTATAAPRILHPRRTPHDFPIHHRRSGKGHRIRGSAPDRIRRRFDPSFEGDGSLASSAGHQVGAASVVASRMARLSAGSLKNA